MDRKIFVIFAVAIFLATVIIYNIWSIVSVQRTIVENNLPDSVKELVANQMASEQSKSDVLLLAFQAPLDRVGERITKKPFGIFITPQNSPVKPERFRGFHTGVDFEIFPEELNVDVPVKAICNGTIAEKKYASGYGGLLVQNCELDRSRINVIYGHLKLVSITKNVGDVLAKGEEIGILGKNYSVETNGERKHLHLGIHKGAMVNVLGYVQSQSELSKWINPCSLGSICK